MINSTKFWISLVTILCLTVVESVLIYSGNLEYTNRYFELVTAIAGIFVGAKTYQNLSFKNGNGNKTQGE